jgi:hypothetical protein
VEVGADRRDPRDAEVPWQPFGVDVARPLQEREREAAHARVDVAVHVPIDGDGGDVGHGVDHALGVLRRRRDDEHRLVVAGLCDAVGDGAVAVVDVDPTFLEPEVRAPLAERGVGRGRHHDVAVGDALLLHAANPGRLHGHEDRLGAARRQEPGQLAGDGRVGGVDHPAREHPRRRRHDVGRHAAQAGEDVRVEGVHPREAVVRSADDLFHVVAGVEHEAEDAAEIGTFVSGGERLEVGGDVMGRTARLGEHTQDSHDFADVSVRAEPTLPLV